MQFAFHRPMNKRPFYYAALAECHMHRTEGCANMTSLSIECNACTIAWFLCANHFTIASFKCVSQEPA
jgi:hypothetical protein